MTVIGTFISKLAKKAGIDESDKGLIDILSNADLSKIKIPDDLANRLDEGLLSIEAAVDNHPTIRAKYLAQFYNAIDKNIDALTQSFGLSDDELKEFTDTKGTHKRIEKLGEIAKAKLEASGKAKGKEGEETEALKTLKAKVDALNAELATAKQQVVEKEKEFEKVRKTDKIDFIKTQAVAGRKTTLDTLAGAAKLSAYNALLQAKLAEKELSVDLDEKGELVLLTKDGSNYFGKDNKKVSFQSLLDEVEAENKLVIASDPEKGNGGGGADPKPGDRFPAGGGADPNKNNVGASLQARIIAANEANNQQ